MLGYSITRTYFLTSINITGRDTPTQAILRKTLVTRLPMTLPHQHLLQHSNLFLHARFTLHGHVSPPT